MVMFHCYVSLPEGISWDYYDMFMGFYGILTWHWSEFLGILDVYTLSFAVTMEKMAHCKRRGRDPGWEMWSEFTIWGTYHPFIIHLWQYLGLVLVYYIVLYVQKSGFRWTDLAYWQNFDTFKPPTRTATLLLHGYLWTSLGLAGIANHIIATSQVRFWCSIFDPSPHLAPKKRRAFPPGRTKPAAKLLS